MTFSGTQTVHNSSSLIKWYVKHHKSTEHQIKWRAYTIIVLIIFYNLDLLQTFFMINQVGDLLEISFFLFCFFHCVLYFGASLVRYVSPFQSLELNIKCHFMKINLSFTCSDSLIWHLFRCVTWCKKVILKLLINFPELFFACEYERITKIQLKLLPTANWGR